MNVLALLLFLVYCGALLIAGAAVYRFNNSHNRNFMNRFVLVGEILLLGSIFMIGQMVLLSIVHLYTGFFLWLVVALNYLWLVDKKTRQFLFINIFKKLSFDFPVVVFSLLLLVFVFRNIYYLSDADSHSTYLYAQKLWLNAKTSIWGSPALDMRVFVPHFNAVPYALGLSLFASNTFFPQLVVAFWTLIALILVFGYASFKMGRYWALAAVMFILFDEHIFYSGANTCCITNSALIALLFAAGYNFWEARQSGGVFRWSLGLIFLSQLLANKYQMFYITLLMAGFGLFVQFSPIGMIKSVFRERRYVITITGAVFFLLLWYLKNYLATGVPTFPILAAQAGVWNWSPDMVEVYNRAYAGGVSPGKIIKYLSFLFVWPGIDALKITLLGILFFPFIAVFLFMRTKVQAERITEILFWFALSMIFIFGLCLVSFLDPRHYRYGLGFFSFGAVLIIRMIMHEVFGTGLQKICVGIVLIGLFLGGQIVFWQGGELIRPSWSDNWNTLTGRLSPEQAMKRYFPKTEAAIKLLKDNPVVARDAAWDTGIAGDAFVGGSPFLLPVLPQVGLWDTTVVKWESYQDPNLIVDDLKRAGIYVLIDVNDTVPRFKSLEEYGQQASQFNRNPSGLAFNYGFPAELDQ